MAKDYESLGKLEVAGVGGHVFVATAREIEDDEVVFREALGAFDEAGDGVGGFERGDDAFGAGKGACGVECGGVGDGEIFGAALIGEPGVLGADGGIVEAGGNGMRRGDLDVFILQNVSVSALENTGARAGKTLMGAEASRELAEFSATATGFEPDP